MSETLWLVSQLCPTLCDPMDSSLPGSSVHGILQARLLEWVAISFSRVKHCKGIKQEESTSGEATCLIVGPPGC